MADALRIRGPTAREVIPARTSSGEAVAGRLEPERHRTERIGKINIPEREELLGRVQRTGELVDDIVIRNATEADLPAIVEIYNQSIPGGWSTADTRPVTVASRIEWFRKFDPARRPIWVVEIDGQVAAWASLSSFYAGRPAYDATAEISMYISTAHHRRGLGRRLKRWVIEQCPRLGVTTLLSMHFDHNEATARINASLGFEPWGHLREIAVVQGQKRGLIISALRIPAEGFAPGPEPDTKSQTRPG